MEGPLAAAEAALRAAVAPEKRKKCQAEVMAIAARYMKEGGDLAKLRSELVGQKLVGVNTKQYELTDHFTKYQQDSVFAADWDLLLANALDAVGVEAKYPYKILLSGKFRDASHASRLKAIEFRRANPGGSAKSFEEKLALPPPPRASPPPPPEGRARRQRGERVDYADPSEPTLEEEEPPLPKKPKPLTFANLTSPPPRGEASAEPLKCRVFREWPQLPVLQPCGYHMAGFETVKQWGIAKEVENGTPGVAKSLCGCGQKIKARDVKVLPYVSDLVALARQNEAEVAAGKEEVARLLALLAEEKAEAAAEVARLLALLAAAEARLRSG
jgi:hypothetical protein